MFGLTEFFKSPFNIALIVGVVIVYFLIASKRGKK